MVGGQEWNRVQLVGWWIFDERTNRGDNKKTNSRYIWEAEENKLDDELLIHYHEPTPFLIFLSLVNDCCILVVPWSLSRISFIQTHRNCTFGSTQS